MAEKRIETDYCIIDICDDYAADGSEKQEILKRCGKILALQISGISKTSKKEEKMRRKSKK